MDPNSDEYKWLCEDLDKVISLIQRPYGGRGEHSILLSKIQILINRIKMSMDNTNPLTGPSNIIVPRPR